MRVGITSLHNLVSKVKRVMKSKNLTYRYNHIRPPRPPSGSDLERKEVGERPLARY